MHSLSPAALAALTFFMAAAPAAAQAAAPRAAKAQVADPSVYGPYGVGVSTVTFTDPSRGDRQITTEVWYPAIVPEGSAGEYYYHLGYGIATRDATPVLDETFALVAFSHGNGGTRVQSINYCEHMASHGYIVAAPDHLANTFYGYDDAATGPSAIDRPLDITYMLDQLLRLNRAGQHPVPGTINPELIAMSGHSYGAYTTLAISGARLDLAAAQADCANGDNLACGAVAYAQELYGPGLRWLDLSDPRVKVSIPQAPGIYQYFGDEGLSYVFTPTAEQSSRNDGVLAWEDEAWPIYQALPGTKYLLTLEYRGHYAYSSAWDVRPFALTCDSIEDCPDRDPSHVIVNTMTVAFLGHELKGEAGWAPYLEASYYNREWPARTAFESVGGP